MGLLPAHEEPGRIFYKGWDEWDHHSVVLEEGGVRLIKMGYKVARSADLDVYEKRAQQFGCLVERMSKGDNPEVGDGVRIVLPSDHVLELYNEMTLVGTELQEGDRLRLMSPLLRRAAALAASRRAEGR